MSWGPSWGLSSNSEIISLHPISPISS